jgi:hypothetical protein
MLVVSERDEPLSNADDTLSDKRPEDLVAGGFEPELKCSSDR